MVAGRGAPASIRVDNGPEVVSRSLDLWAYRTGVSLDFSRPGEPADNAYVGSLGGRPRQECLNRHRFLSPEDAAERIEAWRRDDDQTRPHGALGQRSPSEFAAISGS